MTLTLPARLASRGGRQTAGCVRQGRADPVVSLRGRGLLVIFMDVCECARRQPEPRTWVVVPPGSQVIANGRRIGDGGRGTPTTAASCAFRASISVANSTDGNSSARLATIAPRPA